MCQLARVGIRKGHHRQPTGIDPAIMRQQVEDNPRVEINLEGDARERIVQALNGLTLAYRYGN